MARKGKRRRSARSRAEAEATVADLPIAKRTWAHVSPMVWGVLLALLIRAMVLETFWVPSGSMFPTLLIGDHVIVNKFAYGAKIPFTDIRLPALREPQRGEVVIFELGVRGPGEICPLDECPSYRGEGFVKRVVGVPGDKVEMRKGALWLNGKPVPVDYDGREFQDDAGVMLKVGTETLGEKVHQVLDHPAHPGLPGSPYVVPEGRYFVLGDNRDNSNDSRRWGTVRLDEIKGPVTIIYWSWNNRGSWLSMLNPLTWIRLLAGETRWDRFGDRVI